MLVAGDISILDRVSRTDVKACCTADTIITPARSTALKVYIRHRAYRGTLGTPDTLLSPMPTPGIYPPTHKQRIDQLTLDPRHAASYIILPPLLS